MLRWSLPALLCSVLLAQRVPEAAEPNSAIATATSLPCAAEGAGSLDTPIDVDWWSITLATASELFAETMPGPGAQIGDTILTLLDGTGAPLRTNDNGLGSGWYSRLHADMLPAGTYFLAVERGAQAAATGSYALDVRCAAPFVVNSATLVVEGPENNDPRTGGTPTPVTIDARCTGTLSATGPGGDWDFYRFALLQPSLVRARVDATASHPSTPRADDPVLYLYADGTPPVLMASAAIGSDYGVWNAEIVERLPAGVYQVAVRGLQDSIAGSYYLDLRRITGAAATTNAGGCAGRVLDVLHTDVGPGAPLGLERPAIGRTYTLQGASLGSNGIVLHLYGVTPVNVDLTAFGAPGCWLDVSWIDMVLLFADAAGTVPVVLPLGEDPSLLGVPLVSQLGVLDFSNPLGITTSNSVTGTIGL